MAGSTTSQPRDAAPPDLNDDGNIDDGRSVPERSVRLARGDTDGALLSGNPSSSLSSFCVRHSVIAVSVLNLAAGALVSFFGGVIFKFSPNITESGGASLLDDLWITYVLTIGVFVFCALGASLSRANRSALWHRATPRFLLLLLFPAAMDVVITGLSSLALAFADPSLVTMTKTTTQLLFLALATRLVLKKATSMAQWICLIAAAAGVSFCGLTTVFKASTGVHHTAADQALGLLLSCLAGLLGAARNLVEAALLGDASLPPSALLLAESALSSAVCVPLTPLMLLNPRNSAALDTLTAVFVDQSWAPCTFALYLICAYGKDAGKFWLIKHSSLLRQKLLALTFPFGTWLFGISVYYGGGWRLLPPQGVEVEVPSSLVQLLGFVIILLSNVAYIQLKAPTAAPAFCPRLVKEVLRLARLCAAPSPAPEEVLVASRLESASGTELQVTC